MYRPFRHPPAFRQQALRLACLAAWLTAGHAAFAQTAGMELQGNVPAKPTPTDDAALPRLPAPAASDGATAASTDTSVALQGVRFEGNRALPADVLQAALGPLQGRRFTVAQLYQLAEQVTAVYRSRGYPLAQALVPAQRLADGVLLIQVIEGAIGKVTALGDDPKVPGAQPFLDAGVPAGAPIQSGTLERTMLLLDDQPGFRVRPVLKPGSQFGESDLDVNVERRNHVSGEIGLDNTGNANTGEYRARAALNINSPFRFGDRLSFAALLTDRHLWLGSGEYEAPVGATGTRASVGLSRSSYQLGGAFSSLGASGVAETVSLRLSRALVRSQRTNVLGAATLAHKSLEQRFEAVDLERERKSDALALSLQFDHRDALAGGGVTFGQVAYTAGRLKVDDASRPQDQATAQTEGSFSKLTLDLARIQRLGGPISAYGRVSAQWAPRNLDASEKFGAGGFLGVRAYPMGEASGDRGWLAQTELRSAVGAQGTAFLWADAGSAELNAKPWDAGSQQRRDIAGAGLGARWGQQRWSLEAVLGWRLQGGRPEAESRDRDPRLYVVSSYRLD